VRQDEIGEAEDFQVVARQPDVSITFSPSPSTCVLSTAQSTDVLRGAVVDRQALAPSPNVDADARQ
jgi:hypothetical protein